jgi:GGDEF domain-containing protein
MDTRADWDIALRHEDARVARYGRPAAVLAVRLRMGSNGVADHYAARIGGAIRRQARETDRVTRVGPDRFHVLLPETLEAEATVLAERVRTACVAVIPGATRPEVEILVAAASTSSGGTLAEALRAVQARLEG